MRPASKAFSVAILLLLVLVPGRAAAQGCLGDNGWTNRFVSIDYGQAALSAVVIARSELNHIADHGSCQGTIHAEARLLGGNCTQDGALTHTNNSNKNQVTNRTCTGLSTGVTYHGGGRHWWNNDDPDSGGGYTESTGSVYFNPPSCLDLCQGNAGCECGCFGGTWDGTYCYQSPVMVKIRQNSGNYNLTSLERGVLFDLPAMGTPLRTAWTKAQTAVGLLAIDRNGDGLIDSGAELFGTSTLRLDGSPARNGFEALQDLDTNEDGWVNEDDPQFSSLRLWFDWNHNGVTNDAELVTLQEAGVQSFRTVYRERGRRDRHGNWYRFEGSATTIDGTDLRIFDIYLVTAVPER